MFYYKRSTEDERRPIPTTEFSAPIEVKSIYITPADIGKGERCGSMQP